MVEGLDKSNIHKRFAAVLVILVGLSIIITAQVIGNTQVIDLAEKTRDYFIETAKGNIGGQKTGNIFAQNDLVGTIEEDLQSQGGVLVFLQSPEKMSIISSDTVNDILNGTGANSILVQGLDINFTEISEIVTLASTPTNTVNQYIRINSLIINEVGTYSGSNLGIITATSANSSTVQIEIPATEGVSKSSHYTVPAGMELIITRIFVSVDTGKQISVLLKTRANADDVIFPFSPVIVPRVVKGISIPINAEQKSGIAIKEKTDIWGTAFTSVGTAEVEINLDFIQYAIGS